MEKRNLPEGKQFRKYVYNEINSWKVISFILIIIALLGWLGFLAILFLGDK